MSEGFESFYDGNTRTTHPSFWSSGTQSGGSDFIGAPDGVPSMQQAQVFPYYNSPNFLATVRASTAPPLLDNPSNRLFDPLIEAGFAPQESTQSGTTVAPPSFQEPFGDAQMPYGDSALFMPSPDVSWLVGPPPSEYAHSSTATGAMFPDQLPTLDAPFAGNTRPLISAFQSSEPFGGSDPVAVSFMTDEPRSDSRQTQTGPQRHTGVLDPPSLASFAPQSSVDGSRALIPPQQASSMVHMGRTGSVRSGSGISQGGSTGVRRALISGPAIHPSGPRGIARRRRGYPTPSTAQLPSHRYFSANAERLPHFAQDSSSALNGVGPFDQLSFPTVPPGSQIVPHVSGVNGRPTWLQTNDNVRVNPANLTATYAAYPSMTGNGLNLSRQSAMSVTSQHSEGTMSAPGSVESIAPGPPASLVEDTTSDPHVPLAYSIRFQRCLPYKDWYTPKHNAHFLWLTNEIAVKWKKRSDEERAGLWAVAVMLTAGDFSTLLARVASLDEANQPRAAYPQHPILDGDAWKRFKGAIDGDAPGQVVIAATMNEAQRRVNVNLVLSASDDRPGMKNGTMRVLAIQVGAWLINVAEKDEETTTT